MNKSYIKEEKKSLGKICKIGDLDGISRGYNQRTFMRELVFYMKENSILNRLLSFCFFKF